MNEDAQAALLKTLEEPPAGVTLILCADAEEPLLPTIRSRCARPQAGAGGAPAKSKPPRASMGSPTSPPSARLARIAAGRPGLALAWARQPEALRARDELSRSLLDLLDARPAERLAGVRAAVLRAAALTTVGDRVADGSEPVSRSVAGTAAEPVSPAGTAEAGDGGPDVDDAGPPTRTRPLNGDARPRHSSGCGATSRATSR